MDDTDQHIVLPQIVEFVEGRAPSAEQARIQSHIARCERCRGEVARLERLLQLTRTDTSEEVPPHLTSRAVRLMRQRAGAPQPNLRRRILAALRFDSAQTPLATTRSGQTAARQLLFGADEYAVDLRISPAGAQWAVAGQVLGPQAAGRVTLRGPITAEAALSELSAFRLPLVEPGSYTLMVELEGLTIETALELGTS